MKIRTDRVFFSKLRIQWMIVLVIMLSGFAAAQDDTYYSTLAPSATTFIDDLKARLRLNATKVPYDQYDETNVANFASYANGDGTRSVVCVYSSYVYTYTPPFTWGTFSREHTWCYSWMPSNGSTSTDEYSDQHHLFPTEQNHANGVRSNHPLANLATVKTVWNDCKFGTDANGKTAFEPRAQHKGDAARALLYMCVRYDGTNGNNWTFNWLNNTKLPALNEGTIDLNTLLQWHKQDPPDKWEVDRNNYIQSIQKNRNPFVDHPEYVNYINFNDLTKTAPTYADEPANQLTNLAASQSGSAITLSWTAADAGSQAPSGYLIEAYDKNNYFIPMDGAAYTDDNVLSDGVACVNVSSSTTSYTFSGLTTGKTYYFRVYAYNGTGTSINYKTVGTIPATNLTLSSSSLATAPTAQPTNLQFTSVTGTTMTVSYTAANPAPAGYIVLQKTGSAITGAPVPGTAYTAGNTISDATVAYVGSGTTFSLSSLTSGNTYYFAVYSYNGSGSTTNYLLTSPLTGSQATTSSPGISISTSTLSLGNAVINSAGTALSYTVSATGLSGSLTIAPPSGFQISLSASSGYVSYPNNLSLTPASGTVSNTTIYVRFAPSSAAGTVSGNLTNTSTGATTQTIALSGISLSTEPTTVSTASVSSIASTTASLNFSGGNGTNRIVIMNSGSATSFVPSDGSAQSGVSSVFSSATNQGNGNKIVYDGTGNTVTVTGLTAATSYYFTVIEYNVGTGNSQNYFTSSTASGSFTTYAATPSAQPTALSFSSVTQSGFTVSYTAANPAPAGYLILIKAGSAPTGSPANGTSYSTGGTVGDATVLYSGSNVSTSTVSLNFSTKYYLAVYSYNGTGNAASYLLTSPLSGSVTTSAPAPVLSLTGSLQSFGTIPVNNYSTEQTLTVSGNYLTSNITVTPPTGFQASLSSGTGYVSNPATLSIAPVSGQVNNTTVYLRFAPLSATGATTGDISVSSTGATTQTQTAAGVAIAAEPTAQSALSAQLADAVSATVSASGGNGARRIIVIKAGSTVDFIPVDATTYTGVSSSLASATDQGNGNKIIYDGTGTAVTVTGLSSGTTYYLACYDYNVGTGSSQNYLTALAGTASVSTPSGNVYTWTGSSSSVFSLAANWSPARSTTSNTDVLVFNSGTSHYVSGIATQSIGQLMISNNTAVKFYASSAATLTIAGGSGADLSIAGGSSLSLKGTTAMTINFPTGTTASIAGTVVLDSAAHKLTAADANAVTFQSGSTFITGSKFTSNPFGTTNLNSIVFASGSNYVHRAGSNPFGASGTNSVVVFQTGSWFKLASTGTPSFSGRTYANFELDSAAYNATSTGSLGVTFDTLKITNGNMAIKLKADVSIKKCLFVNTGASLILDSASVNFNGSTAATIEGNGTLSFLKLENIKISNPAGVKLKRDITVKDSLILNSGYLDLANNILTLDTNGIVAGNFASDKMLVTSGSGYIQKITIGTGTINFPLGSLSPSVYSPVSLTLSGFSAISSGLISARVTGSKHPANFANNNYLGRYWEIGSTGITQPVLAANCTYDVGDVTGNEAVLNGGSWNNSRWSPGASANTSLHKLSFTNLTVPASLSAAAADYMGNAAIFKVTAFPGAYYNLETNTLNSCDTIWAVAHLPNAGFDAVDSAAAVLDSVTFSAECPLRNIPDGNYYIAVRHRNSLETWSQSNSIPLAKGRYSSYDFTLSDTCAYGNNLVQCADKWGLYSGDVDQNGQIDFSDMCLIDNDSYNYATGYINTDINGDGAADYTDMSIVDNYSYIYAQVVSPVSASRAGVIFKLRNGHFKFIKK
ncbi:MAG: endonuclease [Ignavibacteria bacterium]|nr:endonuclease [Ignavibacteria bacterium]